MTKYAMQSITVLLLLTCSSMSLASQTAVLIMGVGKSGTSCVAGVLNIMGVDLGDHLRKPDDQFNIKGTFEDFIMTDIDQAIFRAAGIDTYHSHIVRNIDQLPQTQRFKKKIFNHIKKEFKGKEVFGIKSNRMSLLLPFYLSALEQLECTPKIVIVLRNPNNIATSRLKRWPEHYTTQEDVYPHLITYYMSIIEHLAKKLDIFVLYYEDLLDNPEKTINRFQAFIPELRTYQEVKEKINTFLDKGLNHSNSNK